MLPVLFEFGPIKIYSFGLMAALALLAGSWFVKLELDRRGYPEGIWNNYSMAAMLGGFVGAKLNFLLFHPDVLEGNWVRGVFSGAGLVWYGGLIGGVAATFLLSRKYRHSFADLADAFAPALVVAYMLGRVGCLVSGDGDYGYPTDVPWAMAFPNGVVPTDVPVHPTPLYEIALMAVALFVLWKTRTRAWALWGQFGLYLMLAGAERFIVEFWRINPEFALGLTTAQLFSIGLFAVGLVLFARRHRGQAARAGVA
ncbi:MAG: prolipoprotein diacylglyceryl transferase [Candidatus Eisenbacteria bacterium]